MPNIEGGPRPQDTQFDSKEHVQIPEEEGGGFVKQEAYEKQKLAEIAAIYNKRPDTVSGSAKPETPMDVLRAQAAIEDRQHFTPEQKRAELIEKIKDGRETYLMLSEDKKRDLDIIAAALERDPQNIKNVPEDIREKIMNLAKGKDMEKQGPR